MANTYEKLVAAGAPAIVEPLFYRVYEDPINGSVRVEVRERLAYRGSALKAKRTVASRRSSELLENVVAAMTEAVEEVHFKSGLADLTGEHSSADT